MDFTIYFSMPETKTESMVPCKSKHGENVAGILRGCMVLLVLVVK
jgi:hypothetical protein